MEAGMDRTLQEGRELCVNCLLGLPWQEEADEWAVKLIGETEDLDLVAIAADLCLPGKSSAQAIVDTVKYLGGDEALNKPALTRVAAGLFRQKLRGLIERQLGVGEFMDFVAKVNDEFPLDVWEQIMRIEKRADGLWEVPLLGSPFVIASICMRDNDLRTQLIKESDAYLRWLDEDIEREGPALACPEP